MFLLHTVNIQNILEYFWNVFFFNLGIFYEYLAFAGYILFNLELIINSLH